MKRSHLRSGKRILNGGVLFLGAAAVIARVAVPPRVAVTNDGQRVPLHLVTSSDTTVLLDAPTLITHVLVIAGVALVLWMFTLPAPRNVVNPPLPMRDATSTQRRATDRPQDVGEGTENDKPPA